MTISSRQGLIDYCLRRLGFPVIEINVDDDQVEDRIDDALQYFQEFHFDGVERLYLTHKVTTAELKFSGLSAPSFQNNEMLVGNTSGATCILYTLSGTTAVNAPFTLVILAVVPDNVYKIQVAPEVSPINISLLSNDGADNPVNFSSAVDT